VPIIAVGLNHKSAPVQVREKLAFSREATARALAMLRTTHGDEHVLLSTCNRTELYHCGTADREALISSLAQAAEARPEELEDHLYCHHDREAVQHLMRVAAGLDSMVVGENEILGQVKEALATAQECGSAGAVLYRLFNEAVSAGKRVRSETQISRGVFSVGGCAVVLAKAIFGDLTGAQVIIIGAGEMAEAVARSLIGNGVKSIFVANRTFERAHELAGQLGGEAIHFDALSNVLIKSQIVISSTAAPHAVITREMIANTMRARRNRPLFFIDIAVPRDIETAVGELDNVYLYNIDDLQQVVEADSQARGREVVKAETILNHHIAQFTAWQTSRAALPAIQDLQEKFEQIRCEELQEALRRLGHLSTADRNHIEQLSRAIVNKILHLPVTRLRNGAGEQAEVVAALRRLFDLQNTSSAADTEQETEESLPDQS
jgi:glutamyl-tRNA reductase